MRQAIRQPRIEKADLSDNEKLLIQQVVTGVNQRYQDYPEDKLSTDVLSDRVEYELNTILNMGFADYFLIVSDFLKVGTMLGHIPEERLEYLRANVKNMSIDEMMSFIKEDMSYPGLTIGLGRGSGAGSVAAYALRITNIEPTRYGLLFERFLNPERVSMPDIDSDLSRADAMYGVRDIVIEYVAKKYGHNAICGIATQSTLAAKAAIDQVSRVMMSKALQKAGCDTADKAARSRMDREYKDKYYALADKIKALIPDEPGTTFNSEIKDNITVADIIRQQFANDRDALEILTYALQLEGVNYNYGKHAAGVIIADNGDVGAYGALMYDDEIGWKLQMDGPDAEGIGGLLKMDFLGLKTLNIITATVRIVYENTNHQVYIDPLNLPDEPEVYKEIFAKGNTFGIFQFNKPGVQRILKKFQPDSLEDLILINAINRPGPMQYIDPIIDKKHGRKVATNAFDKVQCIQDILAPTYGYPVYQEQVMQIFQKMGQYSLGGADEIRRAMSKKKQYIIDENREIFVHGGQLVNHDTHKSVDVPGAESIGIPADDSYAVFDSIQDFAKYGFNKSHAAVYAVTAYITAWLKYHYPAEFFTAYLNITQPTPTETLSDMLAAARTHGVQIMPPDINKSRDIFTCQDGKIYYGFQGAGLKAAMSKESHDYVSIPDFFMRTTLGGATIEKLIRVGAFDHFVSSRTALLKVAPIYLDIREDYKKASDTAQLNQELLADMDNGVVIDKKKYKLDKRKTMPKREEVQKKYETALQKIEEAKKDLSAQIIPVVQFPDDPAFRLAQEKEYLSIYVSGHPVDIYGNADKYGCKAIAEAQEGNCEIMGLIQNLRITAKKSDPTQQMAFFTLEDSTGTIPVCVFTKAYQMYSDRIAEDRIVKLSGYIKPDTRQSAGEAVMQFVVSDRTQDAIQPLAAKPCDVYTEIPGIEVLSKLQYKLTPYNDSNGHSVYVRDLTTGDFFYLDNIKVSDEALKQKLVKKDHLIPTLS